MNEFYVYIAVRNSDLAIMRVFCYEPLCVEYIEAYNNEEPNIEDHLHKEAYYLQQERDW